MKNNFPDYITTYRRQPYDFHGSIYVVIDTLVFKRDTILDHLLPLSNLEFALSIEKGTGFLNFQHLILSNTALNFDKRRSFKYLRRDKDYSPADLDKFRQSEVFVNILKDQSIKLNRCAELCDNKDSVLYYFIDLGVDITDTSIDFPLEADKDMVIHALYKEGLLTEKKNLEYYYIYNKYDLDSVYSQLGRKVCREVKVRDKVLLHANQRLVNCN